MPATLEKINDRSQEISRFGAFYANLLLRARVDTTEKIRDKEIFEKFRGPHFGKEDFNKVCSELNTHYLVRDELQFQNSISLDRSIYNCTLKKIDELHLSEKSDLFFLMRSATEKSFPFVPSKKRQMVVSSSQNRIKELIFVVDLSPSFQREREEWVQFVKNSSWGTMTSIRLVTFAEGKQSIFPKAKSSAELRVQLETLKSFGKSSLEDVSDALVNVKRSLLQSGARSTPYQDIILLTNAKGKIPNPTLSSVLQDLSSLGYGIRLFTAPYFSTSQIQFYKGIFSKGNFHEITYFRKISTDKDSRTIVFRGRQIYFTHSSVSSSQILSENSLNRVSYSGKYSESESINPLNFTEIYSELTGDKILAAEPLQDNLTFLLSQNLLQEELKSDGISVLIKSGDRAFWLGLPKNIQTPQTDELVTYQTTYVPSGSSVDGVLNVPDLTESYKGSASQILDCTPIQVRNYFQNTNKSSFDCIVRGQVLQVKGL